MKKLLLVLGLMALASAPAMAAETPRGRLTGGEAYSLPDWFKPSFYDIPSELEEVAARDQHLLLFMHLDECPYCARLLSENFRDGSNRVLLQQHFDVIAINVRGMNTVQWVDGKSYTEKQLTNEVLKTFATPTLVFLDGRGKVVLKLNGYRSPRPFRQALEYVQGRHYLKESLSDYAARQPAKVAYRFRPHPLIIEASDLGGERGPLAVIFEDRDCADCEEFHTWVLNHADVLPELKKFRMVRFDSYSDAPMIDVAGHRTTPRTWAKQLGLTYRPGVVLFNEGRERARIDGMLYKYHVMELLRYVSGRYYLTYPTFRAYGAARREELTRQGIDIDYSR